MQACFGSAVVVHRVSRSDIGAKNVQRDAAPVDILGVNWVETWKRAERRHMEVVRAGVKAGRWDAIEVALRRWARSHERVGEAATTKLRLTGSPARGRC